MRLASALIAALALALALPADAAAPSVRREPSRRPAPGPPPGRGPIRPELPTIPPIGTLPAPSCAAMTTTGEILRAEVTSPRPGTVLTAYGNDCPPAIVVEGTGSVGLTLSDLYFVIDSSGSTERCSGFDVDEDGLIGMPPPFGRTCSDPGDSLLAAEVRAVRDFVATLTPATTRVAIIQFSSPPGVTAGSQQRIVQSLTSDFLLVNGALDLILFDGPAGATDYGGASALVLTELTANGLPATRRQRTYFLSDGVPTFPQPPFSDEDPDDSQAAIDGADLLAAQGMRMDTFGVGFFPSVTQDPVVPLRCLTTGPSGPVEVSTLECMSLRTGGEFFASTNPEEIVERLLQSRPAGIESVTIVNLTNGATEVVTPSPDGTFAATLPIDEGVVNELTITVRAEDGTECTIETNVLSLCYAAGCSPLTQGYWHRQCQGLGLIPNDGVGPPPHPDWEPEILLRLMAGVTDLLVAQLGSPADRTTCQGLDADPQDDACQRAIKQYTAVLMNMYGGRLGPDCLLELPGLGIVSPEEARAILEGLIIEGLAGNEDACKRANDLADLINTGAAVI